MINTEVQQGCKNLPKHKSLCYAWLCHVYNEAHSRSDANLDNCASLYPAIICIFRISISNIDVLHVLLVRFKSHTWSEMLNPYIHFHFGLTTPFFRVSQLRCLDHAQLIPDQSRHRFTDWFGDSILPVTHRCVKRSASHWWMNRGRGRAAIGCSCFFLAYFLPNLYLQLL